MKFFQESICYTFLYFNTFKGKSFLNVAFSLTRKETFTIFFEVSGFFEWSSLSVLNEFYFISLCFSWTQHAKGYYSCKINHLVHEITTKVNFQHDSIFLYVANL